MKDKALKGEVFCRLKTIGRQYKRLQKHIYPTEGPEELLRLTIKIIDLIVERFSIFTPDQVKHIAQLCCLFETFCGYLNETRMGNVPWSIMPALEGLFSLIQKGSEFAICPIWESNYKVVTRNVVALYKELGSSGNLLFDAPDNVTLESEMNRFFGVNAKGIYFLFYPRLERISAVHFAMLGHEIGHIYSDKWSVSGFAVLIKKHNLENTFAKIATEEWKKSLIGKTAGENPDLFETTVVAIKKSEMINMCWKVMKEIMADIYGAYVFGDAALVAQLLFFQRGDIDDASQWNDMYSSAYPSHRFRLKLTFDAIKYLKKVNKFPSSVECGWEAMIDQCCSGAIVDEKANDYVRSFLQILEHEKEDLFDQVARELDTNIFTKHVEKEMINEGVGRLKNGIPPNAYVDNSFKEIPIDFRNILYATTLCLATEMPDDLEEYERKSKMINHLGIKAIELSTEQERFREYDNTYKKRFIG